MEALKQPFNPRPRELDPVEGGVNWGGNQATLRLVSVQRTKTLNW